MFGALGQQFADELGNLTRINQGTMHDMMFMVMYIDFLCRWELEGEKTYEYEYTQNMILPSEAKCLAKHSDKIFGTNFCVNFYIEA